MHLAGPEVFRTSNFLLRILNLHPTHRLHVTVFDDILFSVQESFKQSNQSFKMPPYHLLQIHGISCLYLTNTLISCESSSFRDFFFTTQTFYSYVVLPRRKKNLSYTRIKQYEEVDSAMNVSMWKELL
ncbi:hypothetical protein ACKWTF_010421 [Chironomus riparius]